MDDARRNAAVGAKGIVAGGRLRASFLEGKRNSVSRCQFSVFSFFQFRGAQRKAEPQMLQYDASRTEYLPHCAHRRETP